MIRLFIKNILQNNIIYWYYDRVTIRKVNEFITTFYNNDNTITVLVVFEIVTEIYCDMNT